MNISKIKRVDMPLKKASDLFTQKQIGAMINKHETTLNNWIASDRNIYVEVEYKIMGWYEEM